jgi:hypothetical protein
MLRQIKTLRNKAQIELVIETNEPRKIAIFGFDADPKHPNTDYFKKQLEVKGRQKYVFNMPQTPNVLNVLIFDQVEKATEHPKTFKLISLTRRIFFPKGIIINQHTRDFVKFWMNFSEKAGYLPRGKRYSDAKKQFIVEYLDYIPADDGVTKLPTPARIHKTNNIIQVGYDMFSEMTVFGRDMIGFHEYAHNFINTHKDSEMEADTNACKLYGALNFPIADGIYAWSQMFTWHPITEARMKNIEHVLSKYGEPIIQLK